MSAATIARPAKAATFAALFGFAPKARAEGGDDDDKKDPAAVRAEGDDDEDANDKDKDARAEGDDDEDETGDKKGKKAKTAKADGDDEECAEDDETDDKDASAKAARLAERGRWAKVLSSSAAAASPAHGVMACALLTDTGLSAGAVISALGRLPAVNAGRGRLGDRMASVRVENPGAGGGEAPDPADPKSLAAAIGAAAKKARGR